MPKPRTFDEHLQLYTAFAHAVSAFDAATWNRIRARCAAFDEASLSASCSLRYGRLHGESRAGFVAGPSLGVRVAIHAAGAAVLYHDFLSDHDFATSYKVVAPELAFAELERRTIFV